MGYFNLEQYFSRDAEKNEIKFLGCLHNILSPLPISEYL